MRKYLLFITILGTLLLTSIPYPINADTPPSLVTSRVSISSNQVQGNNESSQQAISSDGRYVAFVSEASNLVPGDTNGLPDIFLRDLQSNITTRVTKSYTGSQAYGYYYDPSISDDGNYLVFSSNAFNLVPGDTNGESDIFLYNIQTTTITLVSISTNGSQGNDDSYDPDISSDGRYITFGSKASNLVSGDQNQEADVFLHDVQTGNTTLISVASGGTQGDTFSTAPSISADGRYIVFASRSTTYGHLNPSGHINLYRHDTQTGETQIVSTSSDGIPGNCCSSNPSLSNNGRFVVFNSCATSFVSKDTNGAWDVFLKDIDTGPIARISVSNDGNLGNDYSTNPSISGDGRYITYLSMASNLVSGDTNQVMDIFLYNIQSAETMRISIASNGQQGNFEVDYNTPAISGNGQYIVYTSHASNLVMGDSNGQTDVFIHDQQGKTLIFIDVLPDHWANDHIEAIYQSGLTSGYPDGTYRPENPVTRAEMAVFLLNGMGITPPTLDGSHPFSDISGHWAEAYIEELYDQGITGGYPDGTYRPESLVTRAEMAVFLLNAMSVNPPTLDGSNPFSDVAGHWAEIFIEELFDQGITGGFPDGTYRPENRVTRAEMAVFLVNAFNIPLP